MATALGPLSLRDGHMAVAIRPERTAKCCSVKPRLYRYILPLFYFIYRSEYVSAALAANMINTSCIIAAVADSTDIHRQQELRCCCRGSFIIHSRLSVNTRNNFLPTKLPNREVSTIAFRCRERRNATWTQIWHPSCSSARLIVA